MAQKIPCAIRILKAKSELKINDMAIYGSTGSSFLYSGDKQITFFSGEIIFNSKEKWTFLQSNLQLVSSGEVWFEGKSVNEFLIRNLNAEIQIESPSHKMQAQEILPVGMENWYSLIHQRGKIEQGIMRPINISEHLQKWNKVYPLRKSSLAGYKKLWSSSVEQSSMLYESIAKRRIASQMEQESIYQERVRAKELEKENLRKLFRARYER